MRVYLAAPFFTPSQLHTVEQVEHALLSAKDVHLYSPRQDGIVLKDLPVHARAAKCKQVFATNVEKLDWCDLVVAVIDDRDTGTTWEMGYAHGKGKRIVTYTTQDYGLNVMLQACVCAHVKSLANLAYLFQKGVPDDLCAQFRTFNQEVT